MRAAAVLNEGKKIAILAGQGALNARNEIIAVAERLEAPIIKALLGKAVVPDDCPYTTGGIGLLGTKASQEALEECDTLLIAGSSFPYIEFYPKPGKARCVQIDIDPSRIGLRYPVEVGIVADCAKALSALLPKLKTKREPRFSRRRAQGNEEVGRANARTQHAAGQADEAASGRLGTGQAAARQRDNFERFRNDFHLVRPAHSSEERAEAFSFRNAGDHGERTALHHRGPDRLSGPPVRWICRRRRIHDADGRIRDGGASTSCRSRLW